MAELSVKTYQEKVDQWINTLGVRYFSELTNMAILAEEVGEVARIMARRFGDQDGQRPVPFKGPGRRTRRRAVRGDLHRQSDGHRPDGCPGKKPGEKKPPGQDPPYQQSRPVQIKNAGKHTGLSISPIQIKTTPGFLRTFFLRLGRGAEHGKRLRRAEAHAARNPGGQSGLNAVDDLAMVQTSGKTGAVWASLAGAFDQIPDFKIKSVSFYVSVHVNNTPGPDTRRGYPPGSKKG